MKYAALVALQLLAACMEGKKMAAQQWGSSTDVKNVLLAGQAARELVRVVLPRSENLTVYLSLEPHASADAYYLVADVTWGAGGGAAMTETVNVAPRGAAFHYCASELTVRVRQGNGGFVSLSGDETGRVLAAVSRGVPITRYERVGTASVQFTNVGPEFGQPILIIPKWASGVIFSGYAEDTVTLIEGTTPPNWPTNSGTGTRFKPLSGARKRVSSTEILWLSPYATAVKIVPANVPSTAQGQYDVTWVTSL